MSRKEKVLAPDTLSWGTRIAYGCGDTACNVVFGMVNTLLTLFYTDYVGVSVATIGLVMLLSRIFDGSSDIIMGFIVDKTHSKWSKGRPWLLWMAVLYALSAISLFTVPQTSESLQFWYIFVSYNLCTTVIYTAINVPFSLFPNFLAKHSYGFANTLSKKDRLRAVFLVSFDSCMAQVHDIQ